MSRKFRWTLEGTFPAGNLESSFVKVQSRPNIEIEESHDHNKPAKPTEGKWQNITTTFTDQTSEDNTGLYKILASIYKFAEEKNEDGTPKIDPSMVGELKLKLLCPYYTYTQPTPEEIENNKKINEERKAKGQQPVMGIGAIGLGGFGGQFSHWEPLEEWTLKNCWPTQINFGELDYSSSDVCDVEVTWRYTEVFYKTMMPSYSLPCEPKKD